jgi:hypothetical protein
MSYHSELSEAELHSTHRWTVTDSAARIALAVTPDDVGKICRQIDTKHFYILEDDDPKTWTLLFDTPVTADSLGLGNVDNTSDADKPISDATQTALDNKQNFNGILTLLGVLDPIGNTGKVIAVTVTEDGFELVDQEAGGGGGSDPNVFEWSGIANASINPLILGVIPVADIPIVGTNPHLIIQLHIFAVSRDNSSAKGYKTIVLNPAIIRRDTGSGDTTTVVNTTNTVLVNNSGNQAISFSITGAGDVNVQAGFAAVGSCTENLWAVRITQVPCTFDGVL